jgi:hypothetical protein
LLRGAKRRGNLDPESTMFDGIASRSLSLGGRRADLGSR